MSSEPERLLLLAEGFSGDPHYGKTARGVLAYGERPVVALLDSTRAGETQSGVPIVSAVDDALALSPTTALVGVATAGGRFPPEWRELVKSCIANGLHVELTVSDAPTPAITSPSATASTTASACTSPGSKPTPH